ncbi:MAG: FkbM family methyltransferase [Nitrososphaeria archaeon]
MSLFSYEGLRMEIPKGYEFVYYATFIAGEWDFLNVKNTDVVLDAGAFVGDYTVKVARKAKEVVAVEPLPWAFKILKENVEINQLKNVVLVNKALYSVDGVKLNISDEGTGSKLSDEGIKVETTTIESLGKFSVVKMDIEGAEGKVVKGDWLNHVREIAIELHGKENVRKIPEILKERGFEIRFMNKGHIVKNTIRNVILHFPSFLRAEANTKIFTKYLFTRKYEVPALTKEEYKILYGRIKT